MATTRKPPAAATKRSNTTTKRSGTTAKRSETTENRSASRPDRPESVGADGAQPVTYIALQQRRERLRARLRKTH